MREIEFRGKHTQINEWVYGFFFLDAYNNPRIVNGNRTYYIIPETVGEYTGLKDMKGVKIFEGDIVSYWAGNIYECNDGDILINKKRYRRCINEHREVVFAGGEFRIKNGNTLNSFYGESALEVIGNIHDAPELLNRKE